MSTFYLDYENGNDSNNGSSWALAWKTFGSGATAARIAPGDIIRIAKSPAPSSIGTATWTNKSKTVALDSAQNTNIDMCEVAWTAAAGGDVTVARTAAATDAKEGSYCMKLTFDSSVQASIKEAYYATGELDLSSYQKITFWIKNSGAITAGTIRIALCSDVAGATPVDYFDIPAIASYGYWIPLTLTKSGGGNLGSSIKSIALYTNSAVTGLASKYIYVDDFVACTTSGLNLQSLISKNSLEQGGTEPWLGIQSINGSNVLIDSETATLPTGGKGYFGTSENVTTYIRETIKTSLASSYSTQINVVQDSGSLAGGYIEFQGGYDTSTSQQTGETFFDGLSGAGYGIYLSNKSYIKFNRISLSRYYDGFYLSGSNSNYFVTIQNLIGHTDAGLRLGLDSSYNIFDSIVNACNNGVAAIFIFQSSDNIFSSITSVNNNTNYGLEFTQSSTRNIIKSIGAHNNYYGVCFYSSGSFNKVYSLVSSDNSNGAIQLYGTAGLNFIKDCSISESTKVVQNTDSYSCLCSQNHQGVEGDNYIYLFGCVINSLTNTRTGGSGLMWKFSPTSTASKPRIVLAEIPVNADSQVTVTVYCKKNHATNISAQLFCRGGQLAGISSDVVDTKADDTDWEQLQIQFTPTESGVVEIEGVVSLVGTSTYAYFADINVSQA